MSNAMHLECQPTSNPTNERIEHLEFVLRGFYWDQVDYIKRNHLGGMDNHWMRATRIALSIRPDDPMPTHEPSGGRCVDCGKQIDMPVLGRCLACHGKAYPVATATSQIGVLAELAGVTRCDATTAYGKSEALRCWKPQGHFGDHEFP